MDTKPSEKLLKFREELDALCAKYNYHQHGVFKSNPEGLIAEITDQSGQQSVPQQAQEPQENAPQQAAS